VHAVVNDETCKNPTCNICVQVCFYEALSQNPEGKIDVHTDNCIGCELCLDVCPFDSIEMKETAPAQFDQGYFNIPEGIFEHDKFKTNRNNMETIRRDSPKFKEEPAE
jgi:Fe-S-cluster-containing hydrogenase component 2